MNDWQQTFSAAGLQAWSSLARRLQIRVYITAKRAPKGSTLRTDNAYIKIIFNSPKLQRHQRHCVLQIAMQRSGRKHGYPMLYRHGTIAIFRGSYIGWNMSVRGFDFSHRLGHTTLGARVCSQKQWEWGGGHKLRPIQGQAVGTLQIGQKQKIVDILRPTSAKAHATPIDHDTVNQAEPTCQGEHSTVSNFLSRACDRRVTELRRVLDAARSTIETVGENARVHAVRRPFQGSHRQECPRSQQELAVP